MTMNMINSLESLIPKYPAVSVALGTFDGVHIGHQSVIRRTVDWACENLGTSVVFTFSNHPLSLIHPNRVPPQLLTQNDKATLIRELGVDLLVAVPFTQELLVMPPEEFITLLQDRLNPKHIIVGPNYSYGKDAAGSPETLRATAQTIGMETEIAPFVVQDGLQVSSTLIRRLVSGGEVARAARMLGRRYSLSGEIIPGDGRGRTLNFPTANMKVARELILPGKGVYAVYVEIEGATHNALCNVGINPTFRTGEVRVESHLLDFDGDLYGKRTTVHFIERLRDEKAFPDKEALILQIQNDVMMARSQFFS